MGTASDGTHGEEALMPTQSDAGVRGSTSYDKGTGRTSADLTNQPETADAENSSDTSLVDGETPSDAW